MVKYRILFAFIFLLLGVEKSIAIDIKLRKETSKENKNEKNCSETVKPTKYVVQKGDHIAAILRTLQLEPVFGKNKSLDQLLKLNSLANPDLIVPTQELTVPFLCEEQVSVWSVKDRGVDRILIRKNDSFITQNNQVVKPGSKINLKEEAKLEKTLITDSAIEKSVDSTDAKKLESNSIAVQDMADGIIKNNTPTENIPRKNIGDVESVPSEVSEALRYRMICDGEWTGTQCVTRYSTLFVDLSGWYNRYDGVDPSVTENNKGVLLSRLNPEAGIGWYNYWTENIKTELYASMQNSTILPETREVPIEQRKKYLGSFQAGLRYETGRWGVGFSVKQFDKQYYRFRFSGLTQPCLGAGNTFTGCGVVVTSASVTALSLDLSYMLFQAGKFRYDMQFAYRQIGNAATGGYTIDSGTGMMGLFRVTHDRVKEYIYGEVTYEKQSQNTSIEVQTSQNLGFTFGYAWKLKDW